MSPVLAAHRPRTAQSTRLSRVGTPCMSGRSRFFALVSSDDIHTLLHSPHDLGLEIRLHRVPSPRWIAGLVVWVGVGVVQAPGALKDVCHPYRHDVLEC